MTVPEATAVVTPAEGSEFASERDQPWAMADAALLRADLTPSAKIVYLVIDLHANRRSKVSFPGEKLIADESALSVRCVRDCIGALEAGGWLRVERRKGRHHRYVVLDPPTPAKSAAAEPRQNLPQGAAKSAAEQEPRTRTTSTGSTVATQPTNPPRSSRAQARRGTATAAKREQPRTVTDSRGTRLPDPFPGDDEQRRQMLDWLAEQGIPNDFAREQLAAFVDYWRALPGPRGRKIDWVATWRNWMRRAWGERRTSRDPGQRKLDAIDRGVEYARQFVGPDGTVDLFRSMRRALT